jgi:hypothetical protein
MGPFSKTNDPRSPRPPKESSDHVPLLPLRRGSQNLNIWNDGENEDAAAVENTLLKHRESDDSFQGFLEDDEEENMIARDKRFSDDDSQINLARVKRSRSRTNSRTSVLPLHRVS